MKDIIERLHDEIINFTGVALLTDELFRMNFGIDIPPIKAAKGKKTIPLKGELIFFDRTIKYSFHGLGCKFFIDDKTTVDFNYKTPEWKYQGFTLFKFWEFVKTRIGEYEDRDL